jgi:hypothetical protein
MADTPVGTAGGFLRYKGITFDLTSAAAFVDQKDDRKPTVLVISAQKAPVEKWKSEADMMRDRAKWNGLAFFLDKEGHVFRSDIHLRGVQSSVSGIFELKLDNPTSKDLSGTVKTSTDTKGPGADVTFHATVPD